MIMDDCGAYLEQRQKGFICVLRRGDEYAVLNNLVETGELVGSDWLLGVWPGR